MSSVFDKNNFFRNLEMLISGKMLIYSTQME